MAGSLSSAKADFITDPALSVSYEDLREQDVPFDFEIKVGENPFHVHRKTITTHSEYFRAMLEHDTKEKQQGFVVVNNLAIDCVRECVEFMYTGTVNIKDETVEDLLKTADMWQLSEFKNNCSDFLKPKVNSGNCVSVLSIATKYRCSDLQKVAKQIYDKNFSIQLSELLEFSKDSFVEFLKTLALDNEVAWDAIMNWIKHDYEKRSEFVLELMKHLYWDDFPSANLLQRLWDESLVKNDTRCREFLFEKLFLDLQVFKSNLSLENIFILKTLSEEFKYVIREIKDSVVHFLKLNFFLLSSYPSIKNMNAEEFIHFFTNDASRGLVSEKTRWDAMMTWINHDRNREEYLPTLVESIRFDLLSKSFLESDVINELLAARKSSSTIVYGLFSQVMLKRSEAFVIVLYSDGKMEALDITTKSWKNFAHLPEPVDNAEIFYFNGKLCLINGSKLFYLQNKEWIERRSGSVEIRGKKKIATLGDFIYVSCNGKLFCYNSLIDSWHEIAKPGQYENINCIAALQGSVYASFGSQLYKLENECWTTQCSTSNFTFSVTSNQKIYFCQENRNVGKFDLVSGYSILKSVPDTNQNQQKSAWDGATFGYENFVSRPKAQAQFGFAQTEAQASFAFGFDPPKVQAAFDCVNRLAVVCGNEIYLYDDLCNSWAFFVKVPEFVSGFKQNTVEINIISVCSFY